MTSTPVEAVVFDWGGTLAEFVALEMIDVWTLAGRHLAPGREAEVAERSRHGGGAISSHHGGADRVGGLKGSTQRLGESTKVR